MIILLSFAALNVTLVFPPPPPFCSPFVVTFNLEQDFHSKLSFVARVEKRDFSADERLLKN